MRAWLLDHGRLLFLDNRGTKCRYLYSSLICRVVLIATHPAIRNKKIIPGTDCTAPEPGMSDFLSEPEED